MVVTPGVAAATGPQIAIMPANVTAIFRFFIERPPRTKLGNYAG
jgi:hypothetical protein